MYSRSYYPTESQPSPPENYDGVTFRETEETNRELPYEAPDFIPEIKPEAQAEPASAAPEAVGTVGRSFNLPFFSGLSLPNLSLGGIFGKEGGLLQNIGIEEILIIAVAAYLIFSGSGDIECAVMLLLLLFIS